MSRRTRSGVGEGHTGTQRPSLRTFVAVCPSNDQRDALAEAIAALAGHLATAEARGGADQREAPRRPAVRWIAPRQAHLTLAFLGDVPRDALEALGAAVGAAVAATPAFPWSLAGLGTFPGRGRPRVLWIGVDAGRAELVSLAAAVRVAAAPWRPEGGRFEPHLTLGRVVTRSPDVAMAVAEAAISLSPMLRVAAAPVEEVAVVVSHLGADGARHEVVARWPLGA